MSRVLFVFVFFISSQLNAQRISHRLYLIGDAGDLSIENNGLKALLEQTVDIAVSSTVLFLGDNIYPKGMPSPGAKARKQAGQIMQAQISMIENVDATVYFIPGNHDWQKGGKAGSNRILYQKQWVDSLKNPLVHFQPERACPGPVEILLSDQVVLIIIDSQWFLHPWEKPEGDDSACEAKTPEDVFIKLEDMLERNRGKRIVVAAHHPIFTYGEHGGMFTLSDHLFPLRPANKNLYIPLPILGSIYPLYRKFFGNIQDTAHPLSKRYRKLMSKLLEQYPGSVYVNGHEHALQYSVKDSVHYITSGSGAKTSVVKEKGYARYASSTNGFASIDIYEDGTSSIKYYEIGSTSTAYEVHLPSLPSFSGQHKNALPDFSKPILAHASNRYEKGRGKMLGINYRGNKRLKCPCLTLVLNTVA